MINYQFSNLAFDNVASVTIINYRSQGAVELTCLSASP